MEIRYEIKQNPTATKWELLDGDLILGEYETLTLAQQAKQEWMSIDILEVEIEDFRADMKRKYHGFISDSEIEKMLIK